MNTGGHGAVPSVGSAEAVLEDFPGLPGEVEDVAAVAGVVPLVELVVDPATGEVVEP